MHTAPAWIGNRELALVSNRGVALGSGAIFLHLHRAETGFDSQGVLSAYVGHFLPNKTYQQMIQAHSTDFRRTLDRLKELPGVISVAGSTEIPYYNRPEQRALNSIAIRKQDDKEQRSNLAVVGADITRAISLRWASRSWTDGTSPRRMTGPRR